MSWNNAKTSGQGGGALTPVQEATLLYFQYNETTDKLVASKSIETILASLFLGATHKITAGGENVFNKNLATDINYSSGWGGLRDHSILANQGAAGIIERSSREYDETMSFVEPDGEVSLVNTTTYTGDATFTNNTSIFGIQFRLAQPLAIGNILHYSLYLGTDDAGIKVFEVNRPIDIAVPDGDFYDLWYDSPAEVFGGTQLYAEIILETAQNSGIFSPLQVYSTLADANERYTLVGLREFDDIKMITSSDVTNDGTLADNSPTEVTTEQAVKTYVDNKVTSGMTYKGGYNASTNTPNLEVAPTGMVIGDFFTVTVAGVFFTTPVEIGDALIAEIDNPTVEADWTILLRHLDAVAIKSLYESNPDTNAFDDAAQSKLAVLPTLLQINDTNGYQILTDSSTKTVGQMSAPDGAQTQITNDGVGSDDANLPSTVTEFVTAPDGEAVLDQLDGVYSITLRIFTRPSTKDKRYLIEFIAQNGGAPISVFSRNLRFAKDLADEDVSISFSKAATADIVGLPISVYITPIGASAIIWGQSLSVIKANAPIA